MNNGIEMGVVEYIKDNENEPITFNSKTELDLYIIDLLSKIIEGDENDNGTD